MFVRFLHHSKKFPNILSTLSWFSSPETHKETVYSLPLPWQNNTICLRTNLHKIIIFTSEFCYICKYILPHLLSAEYEKLSIHLLSIISKCCCLLFFCRFINTIHPNWINNKHFEHILVFCRYFLIHISSKVAVRKLLGSY